MKRTDETIAQTFGIGEKVLEICKNAERSIQRDYRKIDELVRYNQIKVLAAFQRQGVREGHLHGTTGYGYDDGGREVIDKLYADVFGAEDALVRHNIISGTHALSLCFFGILRPGDTLVSLTGTPYDTLRGVIGAKGKGSLADFGIHYAQAEMKNNRPDLRAIGKLVRNPSVKAVLIQRSKGYEWRDTLSCAEIEKIIAYVKNINPKIISIVDNCYGEFTQMEEPCAYGADLIAGSLIKNPGGGIARGGGYIAGKKEYIQLAAYKLNSVGVGKKAGASFEMNREILQGFFMAPHITGEALKAAIFCGSVFSNAGFKVCPMPGARRGDIIQAIEFGTPEGVIAFCKGIQRGAPVDSFAVPEPWPMPGYDCDVIMAAGAFTQGATTELSADAPIRPPYIAYMQGSLVAECGKIGVMIALQGMIDEGLL